MAVEMEQFSIRSAKEAGLFLRYLEKDLRPTYLCDFGSAKECVEKICNEARTSSDIMITLSANVVVHVGK